MESTLVKKQSTYKLIVPENVESKIRYLIRKFPSTEWSGVLFYTYEGTFENDDLVLTCRDIYPMDLGTSTFTTFNMSEDVASYMAENMELFDCQLGMIHSHHSMGAFFSGQDMQNLQQEAENTNNYLSLVVDTKGTYVAAITRRIQAQVEITIKMKDQQASFFGESSTVTSNGNIETKTSDKTIIEYYMLDVERHEVDNSLDYLDRRFEEIDAKKKEAAKLAPVSANTPSKVKDLFEDWDFDEYSRYYDGYSGYNSWLGGNQAKKESPKKKEEVSLDERTGLITIDKEYIHRLATYLITLSFIVDTKKVDLKQWVKKSLTKTYKKIFTSDYSQQAWFEFVINYAVDEISVLFKDLGVSPRDIEEAVGLGLYDELKPYEDNIYIKEYCDYIREYYMV